jgi:DnaK suppressor protein
MKAKTIKTTKLAKPPKKSPAAKATGLAPGKSKSARRARTASSKYESIREDLMRQRSALLLEAGAVLTNRQDQVAFADLTDQAQVEVDRNFVLRLKEREQKLLKKIDAAVERIDNGTFGVCRECGNEIPLPRLQARPVTDLCIECKTRQEDDEKIRATG